MGQMSLEPFCLSPLFFCNCTMVKSAHFFHAFKNKSKKGPRNLILWRQRTRFQENRPGLVRLCLWFLILSFHLQQLWHLEGLIHGPFYLGVHTQNICVQQISECRIWNQTTSAFKCWSCYWRNLRQFFISLFYVSVSCSVKWEVHTYVKFLA